MEIAPSAMDPLQQERRAFSMWGRFDPTMLSYGSAIRVLIQSVELEQQLLIQMAIK
jgi:hypothetical protein